MKKSNKNKSILLMLLGRPNGFSLVEIMVAAGMLGIVSLGVMQLTKNMTRSTKRMKQDFEAQTKIVQISNELNDQNACTATLQNLTLNGDITTTPVPDINKADGTVLIAPGVDFGASVGGRIHIESIGVRGFLNNGDFGTTPGTHYETDTVVVGGVLTNVRRGTAEVLLVFRKGSAADNEDVGGTANASKDAANLGGSLGGLEFTRRFELTVITDNSNEIISCYGNQSQYAQAACGALEGEIENGDCKNITLKNSPALVAAPNPPAPGDLFQNFAMQTWGSVTIRNQNGDAYPAPGAGFPYDPTNGSFSVGKNPNTNTSGNIDLLGSLGVGGGATDPISDDANPGNLDVFNGVAIHGMGGTAMGLTVGDGTPILDQGNIHATNSLGAGTIAVANPIIRAAPQGSVYAQGALGVGVAPPAAAAGSANINGNTRIGVGLGVGSSLANTPAGIGDARIERSLSVGPIAAPGTAGDAIIGNNLEVTTSAAVGAATTAPGGDGELQVKTSIGVGVVPTASAGTIDVGGSIRIGADLTTGGGYRPIVIRNMGTFNSERSGASLPAAIGRQVPTKDWVVSAVSHFLSNEADLASIMSSLSAYASNQPLDGIKSNVCGTTRVRINSGAWVTGNWNGSTCSFDTTVNVCGDSNVNRCSTFWSTHFRAIGGHFYARNSTDTSTTAYMRGSDGYIYTTGNVRGLGYAYFNSYARAARFCIGGSSGNYCITRAESRCGAGQFVVGWEQGQVTCVNATSAGW
ncbi:MAG: hypothetical protein CME70_08905 [Halobacteriovorax sp.]|nr:hypothetical protein [Halobacteriovorax sp.]